VRYPRPPAPRTSLGYLTVAEIACATAVSCWLVGAEGVQGCRLDGPATTRSEAVARLRDRSRRGDQPSGRSQPSQDPRQNELRAVPQVNGMPEEPPGRRDCPAPNVRLQSARLGWRYPRRLDELIRTGAGVPCLVDHGRRRARKAPGHLVGPSLVQHGRRRVGNALGAHASSQPLPAGRRGPWLCRVWRWRAWPLRWW
jgi:hypothetical protein